ncbi:Ankyrin repeat and FYVE domain-containing protein 1 [Phlyctochytrium bullatum]|nr:Ankyrin repeat and FYVE domain-containing protein 1 [Phlyctochytrium bullatum]
MARRRAKERGRPPSQPINAVHDTATASTPSLDPNPLATACIVSLPAELTRHIVRLLHPADLAVLICASRGVRRLFRPAVTEVQFALEHLEARFPGLRAPKEYDELRQKMNGSRGAGNQMYNGAGISAFEAGFNEDDGHDSDEDGDDSDADSFLDFKLELCSDLARVSSNAAYQKLQFEVPLRRLPLCYALAVLKTDNFDRNSFKTITHRDFIDHDMGFSRAEGRVDEGKAVWLERLLSTAICNLGLGFGIRLIEWEGRIYKCKEVNSFVRKLVAFLDSVETVRHIAEIEKNSIELLPVDGTESLDKKLYILPRIFDEPEKNFSKSLQSLAFEACTYCGVSVLRFLLETYPSTFADMARYRSTFNAYLEQAFRHGYVDVVRVLADIMKRPPYCGETPASQRPLVTGDANLPFLVEATRKGDDAMVRALLAFGKDPNVVAHDPPTYRGVRARGKPVIYEHALHVACDNSHTELIDLLLLHGADPLARDSGNFTPLMACRTAEASSALLEAVERHMPHARQELLVAQCAKERTALHWAIVQKDLERVRVLLKAMEKMFHDDGGRAVKNTIFTTTDLYRETVLNQACVAGDDFGTLILSTMFDSAGPDRNTFKDMRKVLLIDDCKGFVPVHSAAMSGHETTLRKTLEVMSAVGDGMRKKLLEMKSGEHERTPLHLAAWNGNLDCVRMLLEHGADVEAVDRSGATPLVLAEKRKRKSVVQVLREAEHTASQRRRTGGRYELRPRVSLEPARVGKRGKR